MPRSRPEPSASEECEARPSERDRADTEAALLRLRADDPELHPSANNPGLPRDPHSRRKALDTHESQPATRERPCAREASALRCERTPGPGPSASLFYFGPVFGGISDDGRNVVFETTHALSPDDRDETLDVYEWAQGESRLM